MKKAGLDDGRKRKRGREGQNGGADVQEDADAAAGGAAGGAVDGAAPAIARQAKPRGRPKGKQTFATQPLQGSAEQQRRMTHASVSLSTSVLHTNAQIGDKGKFVLAFLPTGGKVRGAMSARFVSNVRGHRLPRGTPLLSRTHSARRRNGERVGRTFTSSAPPRATSTTCSARRAKRPKRPFPEQTRRRTAVGIATS